MTTMADVARIAGVSATTVSHVMNKTRPVNPDKVAAVEAAIKATGYAGDGIARSLRTGTTHNIGLAMSSITDPYFGAMVHAMEHAMEHNGGLSGYALLLTDTHDDSDDELRAVTNLLSNRVAGIILAPAADPRLVHELTRDRSVPLVLIDRVPDRPLTGVDAVGVHNVEPVARLVDHLVQVHGHRRIGMIAPKAGVRTTTERVDGYRLGLERNGLAFDAAAVAYLDPIDGDADTTVDALLSLPRTPTALVLGNNVVTVRVMGALRARGIVPPTDMATVSFDDLPWAEAFSPRITTMAQPISELGATAIALMLTRLRDAEAEPQYVRLDPTLHVRESCGCSDS